ncbi:hypothetical protein SAURM35S_04793 [Streptomyces aurantiogriseus]
MATMFSGSAMVRVCTGGVKYQLSSSEPATAEASAGNSPPRSAAATVNDRIQQHVVGQSDTGCERGQQKGEEDGAEYADEPAPADPRPAEPCAPGHGQSAPLARLAMGDQVDVEVGPGRPGDRRTDAGAEDVLPALAAGDAEHDLGGVHAAGEVEERGRYVVADDVVEGAAEVLHQGALDGEFLGRGRGQAVTAGYVDRQHLATGTFLGEPCRPPDQRPSLRATGQADDDPLT